MLIKISYHQVKSEISYWYLLVVSCRLWGLPGVPVHDSWYWCSWDQELHKLALQLHHGPPMEPQLPINHNRPSCGNSDCYPHSHECSWGRNLCIQHPNGAGHCRWSQSSSNDSETWCIAKIHGVSHSQISAWNIQFWRDFDERQPRAQGEDPSGSYGIPTIVGLVHYRLDWSILKLWGMVVIFFVICGNKRLDVFVWNIYTYIWITVKITGIRGKLLVYPTSKFC